MSLLSRAFIALGYAGGIALTLAILWRLQKSLLLRPLEWLSAAATNHPRLCLLALCLLAPAIRLSMLPWFGIPQPRVEDEFCHLLTADTIAHGRLSNPAHPFKQHFETMYVIQEPTYACSYPPGLGATMAAGQAAAGHPWWGVVISTGVMCGAIFWMLAGWTTPFWALVGGLIATFRWGIASYWMNSYFGGSAAAVGGALVLGALPRLFEQRNMRRYSAIVGLGWAIVWLIRPYESVIFGGAAGCVILLWIFWKRPCRKQVLSEQIAPAALIGVLVVGFSVYYNRRLTGNMLEVPLMLTQRVQGVPQSFFWQPEIPEPQNLNETLRENYQWQLAARRSADTPEKLVRSQLMRAGSLWAFFGSIFYVPPFLAALWIARRDSRIRLLGAICAVGFIGTAVYPFYYAHYLAAYTGAVVFFIVQGLNRMSMWSFQKFPAGAIAAATLIIWASWRSSIPSTWKEGDPIPRAPVIEQLERMPGKDLVFVRYGPEHDFHQEWIYNAADIDSSPIVWAREIDRSSDSALLGYFKDRSVWVVYADSTPPRLAPYEGRAGGGTSAQRSAQER